MEPAQYDATAIETAMEELITNGIEGLGHVIGILLNEAMRIERSRVLGAGPYQRTEARLGYANGFKDKRVKSRHGYLNLKVPQVRGEVEFYPSCLEKGLRSERALLVTMAEMYVNGVSTRKVAEVLKRTCGLELTSQDVSRATAQLDEEFEKWRARPLGKVPLLVLDATYEKVRYGGRVISCAILSAIGILDSGHRSVLGLSVSLSEAEVHWRGFLRSLKDRGLYGVQYVVSDDHEGLKGALSCLSGATWQRCQVHFQRNAVAYVPKAAMRKEVADDIRTIFRSLDQEEAERRLAGAVEKYRKAAPKLSDWLEKSCPECFGVFALKPSLRLKLRSTNSIERFNKELKKRTRVAGLFPNAESLERLSTAVLMEISEEWETSKKYLSWEDDPTLAQK